MCYLFHNPDQQLAGIRRETEDEKCEFIIETKHSP